MPNNPHTPTIFKTHVGSDKQIIKFDLSEVLKDGKKKSKARARDDIMANISKNLALENAIKITITIDTEYPPIEVKL